ncbi:MAG: hypothetical protein HGN29_18675 [Asgard group archaeon]|nr:hypothetical protein [Asgard group archaeon]
MEIVTYRNHNLKAALEAKPIDIVKQAFLGVNLVIGFVNEINTKLGDDYLTAFKKNLEHETKNIEVDFAIYDLEELTKELTFVKKNQRLQKLIVKLIHKYMKPARDDHNEQGEYELLLLEWLKAYLLWRYYRTKSIIDILGREKGIKFWKEEIAVRLADYTLETSEERPPIKEVAEGWMKAGVKNKENSLMNFTVVVFDDYRTLVKFDICGVHEALKYLNDPELTYLSYCFVGDVEDERTTKVRRRRRTHSLHLNGFCDEFFWDNEVYPDAKQPPLDFMRKLGKEDAGKIIKEYQGKV